MKPCTYNIDFINYFTLQNICKVPDEVPKKHICVKFNQLRCHWARMNQMGQLLDYVGQPLGQNEPCGVRVDQVDR